MRKIVAAKLEVWDSKSAASGVLKCVAHSCAEATGSRKDIGPSEGEVRRRRTTRLQGDCGTVLRRSAPSATILASLVNPGGGAS